MRPSSQRPRITSAPRAVGRSRRNGWRLLLHGKSQLQGLLLPSLDDLLPELALVLHALQLRLDVLLRDLQQPQDTVVSLFGDHIQNVSKALRTSLPPCFVDTEGHILRAFLPTQELHIGLALIDALSIIKPWAREHANDLCELDNAFRK